MNTKLLVDIPWSSFVHKCNISLLPQSFRFSSTPHELWAKSSFAFGHELRLPRFLWRPRAGVISAIWGDDLCIETVS
jgi:hypothetical protein